MVRRAQFVFIAAVVLAALIVGTQFPLGQILSQKAAINQQTAELQRLQAQSAALSAQVSALGQDSTIATMAHAEFGLVRPGQVAYVILPGASADGVTSGPLSTVAVPPGDLMPSDQAVDGTQAASPLPAPGAGVVSEVLSRLEFWRWAF